MRATIVSIPPMAPSAGGRGSRIRTGDLEYPNRILALSLSFLLLPTMRRNACEMRVSRVRSPTLPPAQTRCVGDIWATQGRHGANRRPGVQGTPSHEIDHE